MTAIIKPTDPVKNKNHARPRFDASTLPPVTDLYKLSACEMVARLKSGSVSANDALDSLEKRIPSVDAEINALPTLCFERARRNADTIASLGPQKCGVLHGLPVTIKDLTPVATVRTTFGSRIYENYIPDESDRLVKQIENNGGIIYAKSNIPEFGVGGTTFNEVFGITRSPRNTRFAAGGSSGGAAASLAAGCAWLSQGSDLAGSLRTPASFCGVTSLRPSPHRIRADSAFLPYGILGTAGPMARNIEDLGLFADAMFSNNPESMLQAARSPAKPRRIAVSQDLGITTVSDRVADCFQKFVDALIKENWNITEEHPDLTGVHDCFDALRAHGYAINMEQTLADYPDALKPEIVWNIKAGLALSPEKIRKEIRAQGELINRASCYMRDLDVLICPATSVLSVPADLRYPGADGETPLPEYYRWLAIAYATTMTALPVITLPCGLADNGMPAGIQLIGKPDGEYQLFRYARMIERVIEKITGWSCAPVAPIGPVTDGMA